MRHTFTPIICSLALLTSDAFSQNGRISLQFLSFPLQIDSEPVELVVGKNRTQRVEIPSNELSKIYRVPLLKTIAVGKMVKDEEGNDKFEIYGQAKNIASKSQIILLIRKGKENKDGFEMIPIDGSLQKFGGGQFLFINASPISIGGLVGKSDFAIQPGKRNLVTPEPNVGKNLAQVTFSYLKADKWKVFADRRWPIIRNSRTLVFFYQDPSTSRLRLHAVRDRIGVAQAAARPR